jgi:oligopeptide/dipeptide ABC transporter ATP-binding protein
MEELLKVKNLSIGIHNVHNERKVLSAVEGISFNINSGEILGIVGESGAGKTLTALSIPGLLGTHMEVMGGEIIFSGRNLIGMPDKALQAIRGKEISMIFQEPFSSLNPLVKIGAQIAETLELHGEKDRALAESKAKELMERLGLPESGKLAKTYPHRLSGGMCQRVMIALAVIGRPRLLIADEPTTALDSDTQGQILALLKEINETMGTSILFISHDLEVIRNLCGRVLVMYSGSILEEGNTDEIFFHPAHEYTRCLLNSVPDRTKKGMDLAAIPGKIPSLEEGRPSGCPFHPRCEKAAPRCAEEFPTARAVSATHASRCVLAEGK